MLAFAALLALLQVASTRADPSPLEPSSTSVFREGEDCKIQWAADPTGVWKVMNIELMTGSNEKMVHLRTVATVDGTDTKNTTFVYPCLAVNPNSQIYFYQFTSPASKTPYWTTRFTIADPEGNTVPPELQETGANGEIVKYGIGTLEDASLIDDPPAYGTDVSGSSSSSSSSITSAPDGGPSVTPTTTNSRSRNVSTNDGSNNNNNDQSSTTSSTTSTNRPTQSGGAVSSQRIAGISILASAIFCGSMLL